jgi:transposase-like protein
MKALPFCPNPRCHLHTPNHPQIEDWFVNAGTYSTIAFGTVRRYRCTECGRYFSEQTFSIDYYAKKTLSYRELFQMLYTTSSIRDMGRAFSVRPETVMNKLSRLARGCLKRFAELRILLRLNEDLVADGFENFTVSQFFPCSINFLVGKRSQLVYWFDHVTLRRKGRMSEVQKAQREALESLFRADPKATAASFRELMGECFHLLSNAHLNELRLFTDEHKTYDWVYRKSVLRQSEQFREAIDHIRIPSKLRRTVQNPLFSVNYVDRQLRKDVAECVRETVCFGRNVSRSVDRLVVYLTYHNLFKPYREQRKDFRSHAEVAGLSSGEVQELKEDLFTERPFLRFYGLEGPWREAWLRTHITPLKDKDDYLPRYAVA